MREIKFRAWDGEAMLSLNEFTWLLFGNSGYQAFCNDLDEDENTNSLESRQWWLLQYTGLKDKNGVEIYEDDFVDCHRDGYCERVFVKDIRKLPPELFGSNLESREVVGNAYQRPELARQP